MSVRTCPKCSEGEIVHDDRGVYCEECGYEPEPVEPFEVEDAETFAAVDEPGADPLVVSEGGCVVPVGGFVLVYGAGGAGKTTACIDWAVHFAAGAPWLGILEPARPLRVLLVENEGPRPEFRRKLRRRLDAWQEFEGSLGLQLEGRLRVLAEPWAMLTLRDDSHRAELGRVLSDIDLVVAGPLSGLGMEGGGTLDEIRAFTLLMQEVRELAGHPVAFLLVHHENKAGSISGAWEGTADTTLHVQAQGHGRTRLYWQKVRWCSALHDTTTHLLWAAGDSFTLEEHEEITEATMVDELLAAVLELPGGSWTKIRPAIRGNDADKANLRDRLLSDGILVNAAAREGQFSLWVADDPAAPRADLSTGLARASATSPRGAPETSRATVPAVRRHGAQHGTGERGSESENTHLHRTVTCLTCEELFEPTDEHSMRCSTCVEAA